MKISEIGLPWCGLDQGLRSIFIVNIAMNISQYNKGYNGFCHKQILQCKFLV